MPDNIETVDKTMFIKGRLDFNNIPETLTLGKNFILAGTGALQINLSGITSSNSATLALLLAWIRACKSINRPVEITNMPNELNQLATITDIKDILHLTPDNHCTK